MRFPCAIGIDRRRIFRRGTVDIGPIASFGIRDRRRQWSFYRRVGGSVARQFTGLMTQAIVVRVRVPCAGGIDCRRVCSGPVSMGCIVPLGVLDCRGRRHFRSRVGGGLARQVTGLVA